MGRSVILGHWVMSVVRYIVGMAVAVFAAVSLSATAQAEVDVRVNLSQQRMLVYVDGELAYSWPVSTARRGYVTPKGVYRPQRMARMHYSRKYNNSPMPYSVFFRGGYAIHGTTATRRLGRPASHGCIRLATGNARQLYHLIKDFNGNARIRIHA